jgi:hypothetical protein
MKKSVVLILAFILISSFVFVKSLRAANSGSVTATVTAQQIAITVAPGTVTYGTLALSGSANTTGVANQTQTATNTGNVAETFNIKGADSSGGWVLAGTIGSEQYKHEFCVTGTGTPPDLCDATPSWVALTTSDQELVNEVAKDGTQKFDLKVTVPSSTTQSGSQNVNVTITAVAH